MALDLTPEQKASAGATSNRPPPTSNGPSRRARIRTAATFMQVAAAAGAVVPVSAAVVLRLRVVEGQQGRQDRPHRLRRRGRRARRRPQPRVHEIVAVCDIRPSNLKRIFKGEPTGPRKGLEQDLRQGHGQEDRQVYDRLQGAARRRQETRASKRSSSPRRCTCTSRSPSKCMKAGLHVLCEKLMARDHHASARR